MEMYPYQQAINPGAPIYKPEAYTQLLGAKKSNELLGKFAGGLLGGYQVQTPGDLMNYGMRGQQSPLLGGTMPTMEQTYTSMAPASSQQVGQTINQGQQVTPINPSGVYTTDETLAQTPEKVVPQGDLSMADVFQLQRALDHGTRNGSYGGNVDAFQYLEDYGDGTFGISNAANEQFSGFMGTPGEPGAIGWSDMDQAQKLQKMVNRFNSRPEYEGGSGEGGSGNSGGGDW